MKEKLKAKEIFELYYSMNDRSLERLYNLLCEKWNQDTTKKVPSLRTLKRWSKEFNWQERLQLRDIENGKQLEKKTNTTIINEKANYRKIIQAALQTFVTELKDKHIKVTTIQDAERLIKLDLLLMGEATDRNDHSFANVEVTDERIKAAYDALRGKTD